MKFVDKYYDAQRANRDNDTLDKERIEVAVTWLKDDTVDAWRHGRMYAFLDPLLERFPDASWLTVGDGRYASDARYIMRKAPDVTATDISEGLLRKAKDMGLISKYSVENAEKLSFRDDSFDFVFCKESYHHFPRPMMAFYEMLRVCRNAAILLEPNDRYLGAGEKTFAKINDGELSALEILRAVLRKAGLLHLLRRLRSSPSRPGVPCSMDFEVSGNYVYSVSRGEFIKAALGIGLPAVAFSWLNDYYEKGVEFEKAEEGSEMFQRVMEKIRQANLKGDFSMLVSVMFKHPPDGALRKAMGEKGYEVMDLPKNPYL